MSSKYVPGATTTSSNLFAALMPAWMFGWSPGTLMMAAWAAVTVNAGAGSRGGRGKASGQQGGARPAHSPEARGQEAGPRSVS